MKLIIAHLPDDALEPVRSELLDLGVHRTTISEVHSSGTQSAMTLRYRGTALHTHLRSELRLECLATAEQSPAVVNVLRGHTSRAGALAGHVAVLDLEEVHQGVSDDHFPDDPRLDVAVQ